MQILSRTAHDSGQIYNIKISIKPDETFRLFAFSDLHYDSPSCDRKQLAHDMERAARDGWIVIVGDIFDAMQGRYDPRRSWPGMRSEYAARVISGESYLDIIVDDAAQFLAPYKHKILMLSYGNHETGVMKNTDTDLLQRLAARLNDGLKNDERVYVGKYAGYIILQAKMNKTGTTSAIIRYHHGFGGTDAPVTRGVIQTNRQSVDDPDADVVLNGDNHQQYLVVVPTRRIVMSKGIMRIINRPRFFVRTPAYSNDGAGGMGWATQTGKSARASGYAVINFSFADSHKNRLRITAEVIANSGA